MPNTILERLDYLSASSFSLILNLAIVVDVSCDIVSYESLTILVVLEVFSICDSLNKLWAYVVLPPYVLYVLPLWS